MSSKHAGLAFRCLVIMTALFWIVAAVYWVLAVWAAAVARWIRTGHRSELAELLGGEASQRWRTLEPKLNDAAETLTFKALVFEVIFLLAWLGGWTEAAARAGLLGTNPLGWYRSQLAQLLASYCYGSAQSLLLQPLRSMSERR